MRYPMLAWALVAALSSLPAMAPAEAPEPGRVLIADFHSEVLSPGDLASFAASLSDALARRSGLAVVDAASREAALHELEAGEGGATASGGRLRLGEMLSASRIVTGSIGKLGAKSYLLNAQLLNAETGEIEKAISKRYLSMALLVDDSRDVVASLLVPAKVVPPDYIVMTPESQRSFYFFPLQYSYFRNAGADAWIVGSVGSGFWITAGKPLGFLAGCYLGYPLSISIAGQEASASDLQLPLVMEAAAGASYSLGFGKRLAVQVAAGAQFSEFLTIPKGGASVPGYSSTFLDIGPFAEASLWYRHSLAGYVKAGVKATYFPHIWERFSGGSGFGFSIQPSISLGFGRN